MSILRLTTIALAGILAIAPSGCTDAVGPEVDPIEQIVFLSTRDGGAGDIFRMNADGTGVENLTRQPAQYYWLSLSPDGRRLAFVRLCNIWVINVDGSAEEQLTNRNGGVAEGCNSRPRWSRDGTRIAFATNREGRRLGHTSGLADVYVMNADGTNPRNVSSSLGEALGFNTPDVTRWSADGRVVFEANGVNAGVPFRRAYSVKPDGTDLRPLFNRIEDNSPFWSPDGSKVVFISARDGRRHVYVMNADGSGERQLTSGPYDDHLPLGSAGSGWSLVDPDYDPWSPDGTRIVFERWGDTSADRSIVYVVNVDGSAPIRLSNAASEFNGWSPSGKRIAFTQWSWPFPPPAGIPEVFIINADGTGLTNVTNHAASDSHAMWMARP